MNDASGIDWTEAFTIGDFIPGGAEFPALWASRAAAFRAQARRFEPDIAYGPHERERLDLFLPDGVPLGLAVFVHGGFWLGFDKSYWSDLAQGALRRGWAVALPSYVLAPEVPIPQITTQIARAITEAAARVAGPIRLAGHSAGGHLVSRMVCADTALPAGVAGRVERVVSISGLHDLRPLQLAKKNDQLGLSAASAASESAALQDPLPGADVVCWVGGDERPEFLRQSALLYEAWLRAGALMRLHVEPDRHHFDVIDDLAEPRSALVDAFVGDMT